MNEMLNVHLKFITNLSFLIATNESHYDRFKGAHKDTKEFKSGLLNINDCFVRFLLVSNYLLNGLYEIKEEKSTAKKAVDMVKNAYRSSLNSDQVSKSFFTFFHNYIYSMFREEVNRSFNVEIKSFQSIKLDKIALNNFLDELSIKSSKKQNNLESNTLNLTLSECEDTYLEYAKSYKAKGNSFPEYGKSYNLAKSFIRGIAGQQIAIEKREREIEKLLNNPLKTEPIGIFTTKIQAEQNKENMVLSSAK